jgi:hypothetical protein
VIICSNPHSYAMARRKCCMTCFKHILRLELFLQMDQYGLVVVWTSDLFGENSFILHWLQRERFLHLPSNRLLTYHMSDARLNWNSELSICMEWGKLENLEKNPWSNLKQCKSWTLCKKPPLIVQDMALTYEVVINMFKVLWLHGILIQSNRVFKIGNNGIYSFQNVWKINNRTSILLHV